MKNLTAVTQAETPVRMVRLVETLQMVLLIVLIVLACLDILGIYVTQISMNVPHNPVKIRDSV